MSLKAIILTGITAAFMSPALAGETPIMIKDGYARSGAKSGAAFFTIMNHSNADDRLIAAASPIAPRVELHTHIEDANGVMKMRQIENGIDVPAGGLHKLKRGGDHVMFMGLDTAMEQGATISITLTFEQAGEVIVDLPVDNNRKTTHGNNAGQHDH
ncbi:MAG: copper chaperone PCu(A)C [Paracoccaceae bacterium]